MQGNDVNQSPLKGSEDAQPDRKPTSDSKSGSKSGSKSSAADRKKKKPHNQGGKYNFEDDPDLTEEEKAEKRRQEEHDRMEKAIRNQFEKEERMMGRKQGAGAIYGNTMTTLVDKASSRSVANEAALKPTKETVQFTDEKPFIYDPYPQYNRKEWQTSKRAEFVPCEGPDGRPVEDIRVFKGAPRDFPPPSFGSYEVLDIDSNLCFERETRLGQYGYANSRNTKLSGDWDLINWGQLQELCVKKNKARFDMRGSPNPFIDSTYGQFDYGLSTADKTNNNDELRRRKKEEKPSGQRYENSRNVEKEQRTAVLIRTYTGHDYTENDKQVIRSMVSELSLRTGGQYQVFLFVHVKDTDILIWDDEDTYQYILHASVPPEFADMAILWNDDAVRSVYTKLDEHTSSVHVAQWLSVQKFSQEFPEFDFVWNWELDSRVIGHHFDFLEKLVKFAKKQPRRGLWERSDRYYIPSIHGDYDTDFRKNVESHAVNGSVWGPPDLPFIKPIGPKPPVKKPEDDDYEWGVGEEADVITLAPIFNPINSSWIGWFDVWGYNDTSHVSLDVPRRATIITQSRVSKRLLDIMHVENLRGNHVSSEMTTQTVALLHGLKAVYAPMPIFFDRPWDGKSLAKWFNGGPNGESGSNGSAMGWGREGRFLGSTWYFRAVPPQRLYLNWMGYEDTNMGGTMWEREYGRPCLPAMILHPIKDVEETPVGYVSKSELPYA
ncbi:uncharacterized protein BCR38DRAFT_351067 [Pseudomassariella vexata]|uniref:Uncharacterized protein n=1 Tax=Pseudomassariella vexata TaxID=1141098 RepID=A0A1Y2DK66_9PEZI|nr:uncharacterized protein BCR38DRAFT_351067 [Pseudomassariella vexata]ORY59623.1 hypothetical protein BCR38DRAFT_351067 [Pseudomassariella vexata]